jgi:hypothetical protein
MLKVLYSCVYLDELDCTRLVALVGLHLQEQKRRWEVLEIGYHDAFHVINMTYFSFVLCSLDMYTCCGKDFTSCA